MDRTEIPSMISYIDSWRKENRMFFDPIDENWPTRNNTDKIIVDYEIDRIKLEFQLSRVLENPEKFINPKLSENKLLELLKYRKKLYEKKFKFMYILEQLNGEHDES